MNKFGSASNQSELQSLGYVLTGKQMTMHTANCLARMSGCTGKSDWVYHFVRFVTMLMFIYNDLSFKIMPNSFEFWTDRSRQIV